MTDDATNARIGERTRDLLQALSNFADMLAIDAPTPVLARQLDELEKVARDIDAMSKSGIFERDVFSMLGDPTRLMRLYELLQHRQAQTPDPE